MAKPEYVNNFQVFVAHGDVISDGETTINFNIVYREGIIDNVDHGKGETATDRVPGSGVIVKTENVASIVMNKNGLYCLRDAINSVVTQMELDEKMNKLSNNKE